MQSVLMGLVMLLYIAVGWILAPVNAWLGYMPIWLIFLTMAILLLLIFGITATLIYFVAVRLIRYFRKRS